MNYVVLEIKTTSNVTTFTAPTAHTTKDSAEHTYHTLCATASTSAVETDTVLLMREDGVVMERECFKHTTN